MKKILIFSHAMELGGVEKSLLGLLEALDTSKYQVDLFLMRHTGELYKYIPPSINLLPEIRQYACLAVPYDVVLRKKLFGVLIGRIQGKVNAKKKVKALQLPKDNDVAIQYSHKYTLPYMPMISNDEYDLAISYLTPHYFVCDKVMAKKKIAWIHTDYSKVAVDVEEQYKMWKQFDTIVSISDSVTLSFTSAFPRLKDRIIMIPSIIPDRYISTMEKALSVKDEMQDDGSIKLLSIGRFCYAKNFDNIPAIGKMISEQGFNIKWYIIGYGHDEQLIRNRIIEADMDGKIILLGKKENPYPYIRACDYYIQPSRYEGKCIAVLEAQMLHKPVIITDYPTSASQLQDGYDGAVVPLDNDKCANGIVEILKNEDVRSHLIEHTFEVNYSNKDKVDSIYSLFE